MKKKKLLKILIGLLVALLLILLVRCTMTHKLASQVSTETNDPYVNSNMDEEKPTATPDRTIKPTAIVVTSTPTPTSTVKPTATAKPTEKPKPVVTTKPTAKPTATAKATETPKPVVTAKPTQKPTPVVTAKPTPTPVVTAKPTQKPTPTPVVTTKPTEKPVPTATPSPAHEHSFTVAITKTIEHPAETHEEAIYEEKDVIVKEAWTEEIELPGQECLQCDYWTSNPEDMGLHCFENGHSCHIHYKYEYIEHPAEYETQKVQTGSKTVVDKEAWTETITTGYKCSCGAEQ